MQLKSGALLGMLIATLCFSCGAAESGRKDVGGEAKILLAKVTAEFENVPLSDCCGFIKGISRIEIVSSQKIGSKEVTLKLANTPVAELLQSVKTQIGAVHRVVDGKILLASADEWKEIDAGKAKFEPAK
jgi:hypothetical protein